MQRRFLQAKIHRATVTSADLNYEGSVSIDRALCKAAGMLEFEEIDVYNISNGSRFTTYVIYGTPGQIQINGAAAHLTKPGDLVILATYAILTPEEIAGHKATILQVDSRNQVTSRREAPVTQP
jgi:aspartate 1-decarboxylase